MNRLVVLLVSVGLACVAISSTCLANPADLRWVGSHAEVSAGDDAVSASWPASLAPSELVGGGLLSL